MIQQPGNTDLSEEPITGRFSIAFYEIFSAIEDYHVKLGYPKVKCNNADRRRQHNEFCLAIGMELSELVESAPWKPWRPENYKKVDEVNMVEELIDIIFFLGSIRELWGLSSEAMANILERKLIENYRRISIGYNKPAEEMGNG